MRQRLFLVLAALALATPLVFGSGGTEQAAGAGKPLEISMLGQMWAPYVEDATPFAEIGKRTNSTITVTWAPQANYAEKINTTLASGNLPDVILSGTTQTLLEQGAIVALDDVLKKYGPNIMKQLKPEDYPSVREFTDGKMYFVPGVFDFGPAYSTMIRKDWLDRVKLPVPESITDWEKVLTAFKAQDANGDGDPNNEIPWAGAFAAGSMSLNTLTPILNAYGIRPGGDNGVWTITADNKCIPYYEHPRFREALALIVRAYKNGLIDKEYLTRTQAELFKIMDNGTAGATQQWAERARISTEAQRPKDPKATWLCVKPMKGPYGDQIMEARVKITGKAHLTIAAQKANKVEGIIKVFDWIYSDPGIELLNYGVEGTNFDRVGGKPVLKPQFKTGFPDYRKAGLGFQPIWAWVWTRESYMQVLLGGKTYEELAEPVKIFYDGLFLNEPYFYQRAPSFVVKASRAKGAQLYPPLSQAQAQVVTGAISVDQFFQEYEKIKSSGFADIIKEVEAAWAKLAAK